MKENINNCFPSSTRHGAGRLTFEKLVEHQVVVHRLCHNLGHLITLKLNERVPFGSSTL